MLSPRSSLTVALVAIAVSATLAACGAPCQNIISAQRQIHDAKTGVPDGRPHAQLRLPHNRLNVLLQSAIEADAIFVEVGLPDGLPLPKLLAEAHRIEVRAAEDGTLGFYTEVLLYFGETRLLALSATVDSRTETVFKDGQATLQIGFDGDSLRSVKPVYPTGAVDTVAAVIGPIIKAAGGRDIPGPLLRPIARRVMEFVTNNAFELIRDQLLSRVGEVAAMNIDMGSAPIERIETRTDRSEQPALVVDIFTTMPVHTGLSAQPATGDPISGTGRLRIAGEAIAELGNWAISEGLAPQAYDSKLRPDPNGAYVPVYAWREGNLPLVVHAYRIEPPCSTIVIGARPEVRVEDGNITVAIVDGNVESVEGSSLVRLGVGLKNLFGGDIEKSETGAASAAFEVGGQRIRAELLEAKLENGELDLTVQLIPPPRNKVSVR